MGVSKNWDTPKWMVYIGKPYKNGWFGSTAIFGNIHIVLGISTFPFRNGHPLFRGQFSKVYPQSPKTKSNHPKVPLPFGRYRAAAGAKKHMQKNGAMTKKHGLVGCLGYVYMGVSKNGGTHKSSILIGFSIINHPFWGTTIFRNTHIYI